MPKDGLDRLRSLSAIYFGAVGALDVPDDVALWGLRLGICQGFDQYANLRPTRMLPGLSSPLSNCKTGDMDWMIVRENTRGEYAGEAQSRCRYLEQVGHKTVPNTVINRDLRRKEMLQEPTT